MANSKIDKSVIAEGVRSFKYTAQDLTVKRMPFTSNTVRQSIDMAKDLREWTRKNNPFKPVNGNKDPLVRQIANASMKGLRAAQQDLLHGDLRFSRLNKEFRAFVGGEDIEHAFDFMNIDYGDFDFGGGDGDGNEDRTMVAMGQSISREFTDTQMASTSATISAVETATDRIATVSLRASEVATNRLISANLANMTRVSTQIGQVHGELTTINQNLSLLVQQGNDVNSFLGQSQKFMENTEQSLNDIKSLLSAIAAPSQKEKKQRNDDALPDWLENGFDPKGYLKYIMNETMTGTMVSYGVGTAFKALHLELPSFIAEEMAQDLGDIKPLKTALEKLLPAVKRFSKLDETISDAVQLFFSRMEKGNLGGVWNILGMQGFGYAKSGSYKTPYYSSGYDKGTIAWNGKSERALQEVIPGYLSNMEGYLKNIAEGLESDRAERRNKPVNEINTGSFRHYDYERGRFYTYDDIVRRTKKEFTDVAQSAFYDIMEKMEEKVHTGDGFNNEMTTIVRKLMEDEDADTSPALYSDFRRTLKRYAREGKLNNAEIDRLWHEINTKSKRQAVSSLNELRRGASDRSNSMYLLGNTLNELKPELKFDTRSNFEEQRRAEYAKEHTAAELREYDRRVEEERRRKEREEGLWGMVKSSLKSTESGKALYEFWEDVRKHGGPINRVLEYAQDYGVEVPILRMVHGIKGYDTGTGIEGLEGNQVIAAHDGEIILTKKQSDRLRAISKFNRAQMLAGEKVRMDLSGNVRTFKNDIKNHTVNVKRRAPVNDIERKFTSDVHNTGVEKAKTVEEETQERLREMSDNIATLTAIELNSSEAESAELKHKSQSKTFDAFFGEKSENGFYQGKMLSGLGNMVLDFKNMLNHAFTGEEYTTSAGTKIAKTDDCLKGNIGKSLATAGDAAARTIFGEGYKESKFFKGISSGFQDFTAGLRATYEGKDVDDEFWARERQNRKLSEGANGAHSSIISKYKDMTPEQRKRTDTLLATKYQGLLSKKAKLEKKYAKNKDSKTAEAIAQVEQDIYRVSRNIDWITKFTEGLSTTTPGGGGITPEEAERIANEVLFGVKDPKDAGKQIFNATQETIDAGNTAHAKLLRNVKFGLGGAIGVTAAKMLGLGAIPSFFLPGGPIGGAILGVGVSILSKNKTFMAHLFGGEDKDGNKIDGIISKDLQEKFKTAGQKILGPATVGAIGGLIFPNAVGTVSHALGPILGGLIGTGPIGGAIIASGAALMLGSKTVKDAFFGEDGNGGLKSVFKSGIDKGKKFLSDNKEALKRLGLGTLAGGLLGTSMFGLSGLALGPTLLGSVIGISSASSKFTDYLFGTKMMTKDKDGNTVWTRDGDGLIGRIGRKISLDIITPIKRVVSNGADRFVEYIRHDIAFSIKSMFSPFTAPIKDATDNLTKAFKKIGDKATKLAKKFFDPLLEIGGGLLSGLTKFSLGVAKFGMGLAGQVVASPLKLLGGIGNLFTKNKSKKIKQANHEFFMGYKDENGKRHSGWWGKYFNALAWGDRISKKTKVKGIKNKISGFFEAINPFEAYAEERQNFAKKRGLENDTAFTGSLFGAEWKRHKDALKRIDTQEAFDKRLESLARDFRDKDKGNNKVQLSKHELDRRNKLLSQAYSAAGVPGFTNMTNEQMMKFIYDPLGKRGENKEKVLAREEERHVEMRNIVEQISDYARDIADVLTGRKDKMTKKERKAYEDEQKKKEEAKTTEGAFKVLAGKDNEEEDNRSWWQRYVDWAWDGTVGKAKRKIRRIKRRGQSVIGHIGRGIENAKEGVDNFIGNVEDGIDNLKRDAIRNKDAMHVVGGKVRDFISNDAKNTAVDFTTAVIGMQVKHNQRKARRQALKNMTPEQRAALREQEKDEKAEKKAKLNRTYDVYKIRFKQNKRRINQLLKDVNNEKDINISAEEAQSLGLDPTADLTEQIRSKARSMKLLSKKAFGKAESMEVALKATKGSIMEMLVGKKSALVGLGTVALGAAVTGLVVKFPEVLDWFKDKAIPFMRDTAWPFLRDTLVGILRGMGAALCGIGDFIRGGQNAVTSFLNFTKTGKWESVSVKEAADNFANSTGSMTLEARSDYLNTASGVADVVGKKVNAPRTMEDYLAAAMVYAGTAYKREIGHDAEITAQGIVEYANKNSWMTNKIFNQILNNVSTEENDGKDYGKKGLFNHSRIQNFKEDQLYNAAMIAANYLNKENADFKALQAAAALDAAGVEEPSVGYGIGHGHFVQNDPRWKNHKYANTGSSFTTIGTGGCGPTALANVAMQNGIRTNPLAVASMAQRMGYTAQGGSNSRLFSEGAGRLGLKSTAIGKGGIKSALANGKKVVFAGKGNAGTLYTRVGHIMSARGLDSRGNAIVDDPLRKRSISVPISKLNRGLTNAWSIGRGDDAETPQQTEETVDIEQMIRTTQDDSMNIVMDDGGRVYIYYQVDPKWASKDLKYNTGNTIGDGGCVISSLGSLLATISGLNYRPDYFTEVLGGQQNSAYAASNNYGGGGLAKLLGAALPPSLKGKNVHRIPIGRDADDEGGGSIYTVQYGVRMHGTPSDITGGTIYYDKDRWPIIDIVRRNVFSNPFVLFGGSKYGKGSGSVSTDIFMNADGTDRYSTHAVLVIPDASNLKYVDSIKNYWTAKDGTEQYTLDSDQLGNGTKFHVFNPGTQNVARQNLNLTYKQLFNEKQGIQSMFFVDRAVDSIPKLASYTNSINPEDAKWFVKSYDNALDPNATGYNVRYADGTSTYNDSTDTNSAGAPNENEGDNFLKKLMAAIGKLGNIAANMLSGIFGGKYQSIYDETTYSYNGSSGGFTRPNYKAPTLTMSDLIDDYIDSHDWARKIKESGNQTAYEQLRRAVEQKLKSGSANLAYTVSSLAPSGVTKYSALPDYAKEHLGKSSLTKDAMQLPESIRLNSTDVENIEEGITRLVWEHESRGDYASIVPNDNGGISAGIGGFHNDNLIEILHRMKHHLENSNNLDDSQRADLADLNDLLNNGLVKRNGAWYINDYQYDKYYGILYRLLQTDVSHKCQDAYLHQMQFESLANLIEAYDTGIFNDPRSIIALGHFQGYGQDYIKGMLNKSTVNRRNLTGFPGVFKELAYNKAEELANTMVGMNTYYSKITPSSYDVGHINRLRDVYAELGGTQSLGFGGGIRDSYNTTGYYDSVETPVAINSVPKVIIEDQPITSRLDTIIEYLRRIVMQAGNTATTAKDNLDIGRGLANDMRMKNAGLERNETLPIYKKDTQHIDKLRDIHNKIARSPRSV